MSTPDPGVMPAPTPAQKQPTLNDSFGQLDGYLEQIRVKLPLPPPGLMNGYMSIMPWVAIVFGALGILFSLLALVGSAVIGPLAILFGSPGTGLGLLLASLFSLVSSVLAVAGGWMMLQRKANGWWLLAIGYVINFLSSLVHAAILSLIVVILIAWVHLEVKPNYTN